MKCFHFPRRGAIHSRGFYDILFANFGYLLPILRALTFLWIKRARSSISKADPAVGTPRTFGSDFKM
jgi:hypothetical protein